MKDLLSNVGSGGGAPAVGAAPAAGGAAAAAEAPKEEEKKEEEKEESDDDMVRHSTSTTSAHTNAYYAGLRSVRLVGFRVLVVVPLYQSYHFENRDVYVRCMAPRENMFI